MSSNPKQKEPSVHEAPDTSAEEAWPLFVDFLKTKESRITLARRIVFDRVFARHDHFRADDLAAEQPKVISVHDGDTPARREVMGEIS